MSTANPIINPRPKQSLFGYILQCCVVVAMVWVHLVSFVFMIVTLGFVAVFAFGLIMKAINMVF